jgi:hypothetical protein
MTRLFIRHAVKDYKTWRAAYDRFESDRQRMGVTGAAVFKGTAFPEDVIIWHDFASLEAAQAFVGSEKLREAMAGAGVVSQPDLWFTETA